MTESQGLAPDSGVIFDVQHCGLYDGPGIRTVIFFKGCPLRCRWCHNPESWRIEPELAFDVERCVGCGACVKACAGRAREVRDGKIRIERDRCAACGACATLCGQHANELIGRKRGVDELVAQVVRDAPFYRASGGGATLSGGEPTLQAGLLFALCAALKSQGVHVALETCGLFKAELLDPLAACVDLFLFDLKHPDPAAHAQWTGADNQIIRANLAALIARCGTARLIPRIPLIPGVNIDPLAVDGFARLLAAAGYAGSVELMPYNPLARGKWARLDRASAYYDAGELDERDLQRVRAQLVERGFESSINR